MVKIAKEHSAFIVVFLVAAVIRFIPLFSYQYSYDELCGLRNSIYPTWQQMVDYGVKLDTHPILVQLIINVTVKLFGYSEAWVKLPFLLFSLGAIIYAYLFSLKWFGKTPALFTASIFSFSYIFLFYAPLARMYSGGLFFSTALMYYLFEICFNDKKKTIHYVWLVVFILLCAFNNHLSALFAFTAAFTGLLLQTKKSILPYIAACAISVVLYLPHWSITMWQFAQGGIGHGQDGWLPAPNKWALFSFLKTVLGSGYTWLMFVMIFAVSLLLTKTKGDSKKRVILLLLFLVNFAIIYFYSILKAPIYQNSVMLFSAPCFIWFLTSFFVIEKPVNVAAVLTVSAVLLFQSLISKDFFNNAVLNQNGYEAKEYVRLEDKYGKGKVEAYFLGSQRYFVIEHELNYKRKFNYHIGEEFNDIHSFVETVNNSNADYILVGEPDHYQLEIIKNKYPYLLDSKQTLNVNYYLFSRLESEKKGNYEEIVATSNLMEPKEYEYSYNRDKLLVSNKTFTYTVDSLDEFCFSVKSDLNKLNLKEGYVILASALVTADVPLDDVGFHFSINNQKDSTLYFSGSDLGQFSVNGSSAYRVYSKIYIGSDFEYWKSQQSKLSCFIWNRSKRKFKLSDFKLEVINYWPARWTWWD